MLHLTEWDARARNFMDRAAHRLRLEAVETSPARAFPALYRSGQAPIQAGRDMLIMQAVAQSGRDAADLRALPGDPSGLRRDLRIFTLEERTLDELTPLIRNLGLRVIDQTRFDVSWGGRTHYVRSFVVEALDKTSPRLDASRGRMKAALSRLLAEEIENDALNELVGRAGFEWREVDLLRAYCGYRLQLGPSIGRDRIYEALLRHVEAAGLLYRYFQTRFHPTGREGELEALNAIRQQLISALEKVEDLTDDRLLREIFNLIDATLRTNFFAPGDPTKRALAIKVDSMGIINAPYPRPFAEIYVRARHLEGIHLRGAKVARGGLRWSDRCENFRTEILDLMQTQMVKNALIVPQGAKGGFVLKTSCGGAAERQQLGMRAYGDFIRSLLDVTDNIIGAKIARPAYLVAYDNADPYLVVAADKGTASWSDEANRIAASYKFWLGDAFATGGSHGYHHKRLGITARGAWLCVERHFLELGRNIDRHAFSVVGVGSMDGDVFGNGMLQSRNIRLCGAFSGQHIFLDPDPDPLISFAERKRLFETPNSTWADYDPRLISRGGGVFRRDAKEIELSEQIRGWLSVRQHAIDAEGLIKLLLTAPVDLLWLGGIGTYVKAGSERDETIGDRANDGARVEASRLRAKIVGEGANLGFTQKARVEYALAGGRINTDAVDNSAGVDLSDHEVNLKILLTPSDERGAGDLEENARNELLAAMADEVCNAALDDSYRQSLCLSLERERSVADIEPFLTVAELFESWGLRDRSIDAFPSRREIALRSAKGLTRPELAQLMAYAKLALKRQLLEAPGFLDADWSRSFLLSYFPPRALQGRVEKAKRHPLAREIAASLISNRIVDQAGASFLLFGEASTPKLLLDAVALYLTFDQIVEGDKWRAAVRKLDGRLEASEQYRRLMQLEDALSHLCRWALQRGKLLTPSETVVAEWREHLRVFAAQASESSEYALFATLAPEMSREFLLKRLRDFPFIVELAQKSNEGVRLAAGLFDEAAALFDLNQISALLADVAARDPWERQLQASLEDSLRLAPARVAALEIRLGLKNPVELFSRAAMESTLANVKRIRTKLLRERSSSLAPFATFAAEMDLLIDACEARCGRG
ncbi:NAD-glutamate dehydrogenase domain-containing protein [Methylocystis parvus]|uniref:NAD-glutamate dehydrogenase n=1 Tax=Methylocystis parvus TaxID=134 RepID=A0A6B8M369_9HYPH|nr:NAD-glutamate dehydrogenase domain-containing protein [Methylocystis parvus]QGM96785.1 NAD-glutamate dehydrogenase [Methylocystis parvus]WBJ99339.1 NAD-glutamate dehydrogenase [Methylocystis parvus OBBP]